MLFKRVKIKTKNMKANIIIIWLIFSFNCLSQNYTKVNKQNNDVSFPEYISIFNSIKLPLNIFCLSDFDKYGDTNWKEVNGKTILVSNSSCPLIPSNYFKYIKDKYPTGKNYYYQSVYKKVLKNYVLLIIEQTNKQSGDYFLKLNTFGFTGNFIDTLTIAGQKIDDYDQFCSIDSSLVIKIRIIKGLPQTQKPGEPSPNIEINEKYIITDDGHFKQIFRNQENGYFRLIKGVWVRVDSKK